jgi:hypothetical protein
VRYLRFLPFLPMEYRDHEYRSENRSLREAKFLPGAAAKKLNLSLPFVNRV